MIDFSLGNFARNVRVLLAVLVAGAGLWGLTSNQVPPAAAQSESSSSNVVLIRLDGAIDNVSARFIRRGLQTAEEQGSKLVVLMLDTPGGLLDSTRDIVESFLNEARDSGATFELLSASETPEEVRDLVGRDGFMRTFPHRQDADGFFAARLVRRS